MCSLGVLTPLLWRCHVALAPSQHTPPRAQHQQVQWLRPASPRCARVDARGHQPSHISCIETRGVGTAAADGDTSAMGHGRLFSLPSSAGMVASKSRTEPIAGPPGGPERLEQSERR